MKFEPKVLEPKTKSEKKAEKARLRAHKLEQKAALKREKKREKQNKIEEKKKGRKEEKPAFKPGDKVSWKAFFPFTAEGKAMRGMKASQKAKKEKKKFSFVPHLRKAGYDYSDDKEVKKKLFKAAVYITFLCSLYFLFVGIRGQTSASKIFVFIFGYWTAVFALTILLVAFSFVLYLDIRAYNRTKEVEAVLPDYLQLASANISAGMPLDRALWFAVRPNFGILAKEVEQVAKSTYAGEDLGDALTEFAEKYDSKVLKRSISLLLEGINAGGEMAKLLNKIAINIEESNIMRKEMAASVTTYTIFIGAATIVGAPFLFGLATQLLVIIQNITGGLGSSTSGSSGMFSFSLNSNAVRLKDFQMYSVLLLSITSFFSGAIISTIKKGNIRDGAITIPVFIAVTVSLYFISTWMLGYFMSGFF